MNHLDRLILQKSCNSFVSERRSTTCRAEKIDIPQSIRGEYRNDYDIVGLSRIIMTKIVREYGDSGDLLVIADDIKEKIERSSDNRERMLLQLRLDSVMEKYETNSSVERLLSFAKRSKELLKEYRLIPASKTSVDIMKVSRILYNPTPNDLVRIDIIEEYITLAKEYIPIELTCTGRQRIYSVSVCSDCEECIEGILADSEGCVECPNCSNINRIGTMRSPSFESNPKSNYEDMENFIKALDRYQGKLAPALSISGTKTSIENVRVLLDNYFSTSPHPTSDVMSSMPLDCYGIRQGSSVSIMLDAMSKVGLKCYCDVYYICRSIWGWKLADLSSIEDRLIADYKLTQEVWCNMPQEKKERESSLPIWYRVLQHLRVRGYKCKAEHFKIPRNIPLYNDIWKYMCDNCGDKTIKYMPL